MRVERFRKRPIEVETMLWDGTEECFAAILAWLGPETLYWHVPHSQQLSLFNSQDRQWLDIPRGHRVARGALGEVYPISPTVISKTYVPSSVEE